MADSREEKSMPGAVEEEARNRNRPDLDSDSGLNLQREIAKDEREWDMAAALSLSLYHSNQIQLY